MTATLVMRSSLAREMPRVGQTEQPRGQPLVRSLRQPRLRRHDRGAARWVLSLDAENWFAGRYIACLPLAAKHHHERCVALLADRGAEAGFETLNRRGRRRRDTRACSRRPGIDTVHVRCQPSEPSPSNSRFNRSVGGAGPRNVRSRTSAKWVSVMSPISRPLNVTRTPLEVNTI